MRVFPPVIFRVFGRLGDLVNLGRHYLLESLVFKALKAQFRHVQRRRLTCIIVKTMGCVKKRRFQV
jgi:hypothetical protein